MISPILTLEAANLFLTYVGITTQATKDSNGKIVELTVYDGFYTIHQIAEKIQSVLGDCFRVTAFTNTDTIRIKPVMREY